MVVVVAEGGTIRGSNLAGPNGAAHYSSGGRRPLAVSRQKEMERSVVQWNRSGIRLFLLAGLDGAINSFPPLTPALSLAL